MAFECPVCEREFACQRGLRVHHSSAQGERLPNRTCAYCGNSFYSEHERTYCSEACLSEAAPYRGSSNPNYRGGRTETTCESCGVCFEYYPSEKEGRFCHTCVREEDWRDPPTLSGGENPRWRGGPTERHCAVCGSTVRRHPSGFAGSVAVCSEPCRRRWLSESFTGERHPNWKGGEIGPYGPGWNRTRAAALDRDGHQCVRCGVTRTTIGRNPDVHHIVPVRDFVEAPLMSRADAHRLVNVVTLCPSCHRRADAGKIREQELVSLLERPRRPST